MIPAHPTPPRRSQGTSTPLAGDFPKGGIHLRSCTHIIIIIINSSSSNYNVSAEKRRFPTPSISFYQMLMHFMHPALANAPISSLHSTTGCLDLSYTFSVTNQLLFLSIFLSVPLMIRPAQVKFFLIVVIISIKCD